MAMQNISLRPPGEERLDEGLPFASCNFVNECDLHLKSSKPMLHILTLQSAAFDWRFGLVSLCLVQLMNQMEYC